MAKGMGVVRTVVVVAGTALLFLTLLWGCQRQLIYLPDRSPVPAAGRIIDGGRDVRLRTDDGVELGAWFVPPAAPDRNVTVLVASGNAGNRTARVPLAAALREAGFGVLLFDYRGYGGNPARPSEAGLALDARAALRWLVDDAGVTPSRILYFGESLGAGVVAGLAIEHPPAGLVLRSPFTELAALGQRHYPFLPVRLLLWDRYPIKEHVARIAAPTTVIFGTRDTIVPPAHSREVAAAAARLFEQVAVEGADHNDPALFAGPEVIAAVERLAGHVGR